MRYIDSLRLHSWRSGSGEIGEGGVEIRAQVGTRVGRRNEFAALVSNTLNAVWIVVPRFCDANNFGREAHDVLIGDR
jgi:hypothetical protein